MRGRLRWEGTTLLCVAVLCGICAGQGEQWLQYRSARDVAIVGDGLRFIPLTPFDSNRPTDVPMPQFKHASPLFAKWKTPMVKAGFLWIGMDRSTKAGPYNLLYIDSNGNGRLDDETPAKPFGVGQYSANFGPVKVVFQIEDGPATYHLNVRFDNYNRDKPNLYVAPGGWYEGDITAGGVKKHCVLFDYNANGTFDDRASDARACDRMAIGDKVGRDASLVGRYIELDGVLYEPQIARDGAFVKLTKAENVKTGRVRLPASVTTCRVGGENGSFILTPKDGTGSLPVGTYRVLNWSSERADDTGAKWQVNGRGPSENVAGFDVAEDKDIQLDIGEPIVASLAVTTTAKTYNLRLITAGRAGETIELLRNGTRPQAPKVKIRNADGTFDRAVNFEYG